MTTRQPAETVRCQSLNDGNDAVYAIPSNDGIFISQGRMNMNRKIGLLANRVNFTNGQYINTKVINGEGLYYQSRSYQGKPWIKGVVEYRGVFFNLDDDYDFQRLLVALLFSGIICKEGNDYAVIEPNLREQLRTSTSYPLMQDILLIVNLQGRILRVLNEQDLIKYNHG